MSAPQAPDSDNIDPDTDWSFLARGDNALYVVKGYGTNRAVF